METLRFKNDGAKRKQLFVEGAMSHPAKGHISMWEEMVLRYSKEGDLVLDPMAGIGTSLVAALLGRTVICVELEPHFVEPMRASWAKMQQHPMLGYTMGQAIILRGDARCLPLGAADSIITSPPWEESVSSGGDQLKALSSVHYQPPSRPTERYRGKANRTRMGYTRPQVLHPASIGVDAVVTSLDTSPGKEYNNNQEVLSWHGKTPPPKPDTIDGIGNTLTKSENASASSWATTGPKQPIPALTAESLAIRGLYGVADVLIRQGLAPTFQARLNNASAPSSKNNTEVVSGSQQQQIEESQRPTLLGLTRISGREDMTAGEELVSTPSRRGSGIWLASVVRFVEALNNWPSTTSSGSSGAETTPTATLFRCAEVAIADLKTNSLISDTQNTMLSLVIQGLHQALGNSLGNIGNERGPSYWASMFLTYQECWRVLRPGGIMALVLKGFTRDGAYVDLPGQTEALLLGSGWSKYDHWRRELWGLSFWRILQKRRDPAAFDERLNFEEVLAFRKPEGPGDVLHPDSPSVGVAAVLTSPPYEGSLVLAENGIDGAKLQQSYGPNSQFARPQSYTRPSAGIMSPPYEGIVGDHKEGPSAGGREESYGRWAKGTANEHGGYSVQTS